PLGIRGGGGVSRRLPVLHHPDGGEAASWPRRYRGGSLLRRAGLGGIKRGRSQFLMLTRSLGVNGPTSSAIGLGCMGMSDFYGPSDRAESIATMRMALDANVTLLDTGDFYGMGHNEMLIAEAIQGRPRDQIILSVKFGAQRDPGGKWVGFDARPAAVKTTWGKIFNSGLLGGSVPVRAAIQGCLCRVYGRGGPSL